MTDHNHDADRPREPSAEPLFRSERTFQIWYYHVSHQHLMLRSGKGTDAPYGPKNVDVMFRGVHYVELPSVLHGIEIVRPDARELETLSDGRAGEVNAKWVRTIVTGGRRFSVVAAFCGVSENDLDLFEVPIDWIPSFSTSQGAFDWSWL